MRSGLHIVWLLMTVLATISSYAQEHCKIRYTYDDAGNRIQRDWYCYTPGEPEPDGGGENKSLKEGPLAALHLKAWPVPATDILYVEIPEEGLGGELALVGSNGSIHSALKVTSATVSLNTSELTQGQYFLTLVKGRERISVPLIIE